MFILISPVTQACLKKKGEMAKKQEREDYLEKQRVKEEKLRDKERFIFVYPIDSYPQIASILKPFDVFRIFRLFLT